MPDGTVFSSVEEGNRVHSTRTSDTSCMIEGDTDGVRKTRVHMILGSRETLMSTISCGLQVGGSWLRMKLANVSSAGPTTGQGKEIVKPIEHLLSATCQDRRKTKRLTSK